MNALGRSVQGVLNRGRRPAREAVTMFLIPGVFGFDDGMGLKDLRRRVRGAIVFEVLTLPDIHEPGRILTDMAATGDVVVREILRRQPEGPIALVGFSFGASLALEVAVQLERAGRDISYLAILDGPFEPMGLGPSAQLPPLVKRRRLMKAIAIETAESIRVVRRLLMSLSRMGRDEDRADVTRRAMLIHLRNRALRRWQPAPCGARGLHVFTGEYGPANRDRWAELCPRLDRTHVEAVHEHLSKGDALDAVAAALVSSARAVLGAGPREPPRAAHA